MQSIEWGVPKMKGILVTLTPRGAFDHLEDIGATYVAGYIENKGISCVYKQLYEKNFDVEDILKTAPDFVLFTIYNITRESVYAACTQVKEQNSQIIVCVGGAEATVRGRDLLQECDSIDFVVKGEGEETTYLLLDALQRNADLMEVEGIIFRSNGAIVETQDRELIRNLDDISWPNRSFLDDRKLTVASLSTSRGCISRCSFCLTHHIWRIWRGRSIINVIDEIKYLYETYGVDCINFTDASLEDPDKKCIRLNELLDQILQLDFPIYFSADFRAEFYKKADPALMKKLIKAGLVRVIVGIESANKEDLELYNKAASVEDNYEVTRLFKEWKIPFYPGFINFNPYSTLDRIKENLKYFSTFGLSGRITLFATELSIFKGSSMYDQVKRDNLLKEDGVSYHYTNENVEKLITFLRRKIKEINGRGEYVISDIDTNLEKAEVLSHTLRKRVASFHSDYETFDRIFQEFEEQYNQLKEALNKKCTEWFAHLIAAAEKGEYDQFENITQSIMEYEFLATHAKRLRSNLLKLMKQLALHGYMVHIKF